MTTETGTLHQLPGNSTVMGQTCCSAEQSAGLLLVAINIGLPVGVASWAATWHSGSPTPTRHNSKPSTGGVTVTAGVSCFVNLNWLMTSELILECLTLYHHLVMRYTS